MANTQDVPAGRDALLKTVRSKILDQIRQDTAPAVDGAGFGQYQKADNNPPGGSFGQYTQADSAA